MKKIISTILVFFVSAGAYATSLPMPESNLPLPVDQVRTGLRLNPHGEGFLGPIVINQDKNGKIEVIVDNNTCTIDGLCTEMAFSPQPASIKLEHDYGTFADYTVQIINPRAMILPMTLTLAKDSSMAAIYWDKTVAGGKSYKWVVKSTEALACEPNTGIPSSDMHNELNANSITPINYKEAYTGHILPMVCGIETSDLHAFLIESDLVEKAKALGFESFSKYPEGDFKNKY